MSTPTPESPSARTGPRRRVRVLVARTVAVLGLVVAVVDMILVGESAGTDRAGLVPLVIGVVVFLIAIPFSRLNSPRPR